MNPEQQCIFYTNTINHDQPSGIELRNRILAGLEAGNRPFIDLARKAFVAELERGPCDLPTALDRQGVTIPPGVNPAALGTVTGGLSRKRVIERTGEIAPAPQRQAHARQNPKWRLVTGGVL